MTNYQDVKQAANQVKQELSEARLQLANKQKDCSRLEVEVQDLKKEYEEERRKCAKYKQEASLLSVTLRLKFSPKKPVHAGDFLLRYPIRR
jgi:archaellum component FlaC